MALGPSGRQEKLREIYQENLRRLGIAIDFCVHEGLHLYRLPSGLFPFSDEQAGWEILSSMRDELRAQGARAARAGLRLVMHPDQYVVLNSEFPGVVRNSIKILRMHSRILDLLGQPRSPWAALQIHGGKSGRSVELIRAISGLEKGIRSRLVLENDERAYGAEEILSICRSVGIPMVFDAHHHVIHERLDSYNDPSVEEHLRAAASTWPDPSWQLVHISNGRDFFRDRRHHDLISVLPGSYDQAPWIEVEAKRKEAAIRKIRAEWPPIATFFAGSNGQWKRRK